MTVAMAFTWDFFFFFLSFFFSFAVEIFEHWPQLQIEFLTR